MKWKKVTVWIRCFSLNSTARFSLFFFFFNIFVFFFFFAFTRFKKVRDKIYCLWYKCHCLLTVSVLFMYCSWDLQLLYIKKSIKNGSHDTIHTFKNYFAIMFSVFSFQFSVSVTISSIQTYPIYSIWEHMSC